MDFTLDASVHPLSNLAVNADTVQLKSPAPIPGGNIIIFARRDLSDSNCVLDLSGLPGGDYKPGEKATKSWIWVTKGRTQRLDSTEEMREV